MDNRGTDYAGDQGIPELDLFAEDSDYEDGVYKENHTTGDDLPPDLISGIQKTNKKGTLLTLDNFWHNTSNSVLEAPRSRRNVLWDFTVFHNLREEREGRYVSCVKQLESEVVLAIKKAKVAILSDVTEAADAQLFVKDVVAVFDYQVGSLVRRFRVNDMNGSPLFSKPADGFDDKNRKVAIEAYLKSNDEFLKLKAKLAGFRVAKNRLISASLARLLSSVNGLRNKVVSEIFEPNSRGCKRMTITRFLRQMDKISSRADFAGEYRFDLLKTFVKNREELESFIQHNATFGSPSDDALHFEDFTNQFTPDYSEWEPNPGPDKTNYEPNVGSSTRSEIGESEMRDHMMDFMNATPPDDMIMSPGEYEASENMAYEDSFFGKPDEPHLIPSTSSEDSKKLQIDEKLERDSDEAQLKLLEEARKRAAEILRQKRLNRTAAE
ncbi:uncharacterized protein BXIN_2061 [Babesia sp. Xinjiang]|uniref:uncharacterized protein n=1 Tax=Babesia sp. Xinjiang TaxID=462227 RepID=UPI000A240DE8|nr:uncharacterized protein BXIN_2061 [Babesia sp. Xinjiang]ORM40603.1 hypothetical protein BXIN_2061 [Babesia sp. Xinjiang]